LFIVSVALSPVVPFANCKVASSGFVQGIAP
jgi:hypothetical protein